MSEIINNKKRSHTQLDSRKQVIAFQDRVMTINIKEAQHPLKREKQVIDKSSIMLKNASAFKLQILVDSDMPCSEVKTTDKNTDTQITDPELFMQ